LGIAIFQEDKMHTYRNESHSGGWTVGHYESGHTSYFEVLKSFPTEATAAAYTNYLNGGEGYYVDEVGNGRYITAPIRTNS
jgi:hypothetical protein